MMFDDDLDDNVLIGDHYLYEPRGWLGHSEEIVDESRKPFPMRVRVDGYVAGVGVRVTSVSPHTGEEYDESICMSVPKEHLRQSWDDHLSDMSNAPYAQVEVPQVAQY